MGAVGLWWAVLFNSRSGKTQFVGNRLAEDARPVSISIIAWLFILGFLSLPFTLAMRWPMAFLGLLLTGWIASAVSTLYAAFQMYVGIGLLRLSPRSRVLAIYYSIFGAVNSILFYSLPGHETRIAAMAKAMPNHFHRPNRPIAPFPHWPIEMMIVTFMIVQIYFLITRKRAFRASPSLAGPQID